MANQTESNGTGPYLKVDAASKDEEAEQQPIQKKYCCLSTLKVFLVAISFAYFARGASGSYMKSSITQIERRFDISSSLVGFIDGSFEIGNLMVIAFVSYFGTKLHRPRLIGAGCLLMSFGAFLKGMPHFFMGQYIYETATIFTTNSTSEIPLCSTTENKYIDMETTSNTFKTTVPGCEKEVRSYMWIFVLLGNILRGIGETPIMPLGISYIDDFAKEENSALYIACVQAVGCLGPLLGFLLGSLCAKLYVDIGFVDLDSITISSRDTRWVGAWWLGFLIVAAISLLAAIPFFFFPKSLPKEGKGKKDSSIIAETSKCIQEDHREPKPSHPQQLTISELTKDFVASLRALLSNPVYFLFLVISILQFNSFIGFFTFMLKYMEQQYGQSASKANFLIGVFNLPAIALGFVLGGIIMKKFKLSILGAAHLGFWTSLFDFCVCLSFFAMSCENSRVAGLTVSYEGLKQVSFQESTLISDCNSGCHCSSKQWDPVCGTNGIAYVTPCLAGCESTSGTGKNRLFHNCSCITVSGSLSGNFSATLQQCERGEDCTKMVNYFLAISLIVSIISCIGCTPGYMVLIRCIKPELKSFAVGIHALSTRALAGIPAPVYIGALIDKTCLKWGTTKCGGRGACRLYDTDAYRLIYLGVTTAMRAASYVPCVAVLYLLKKQASNNMKNSNGGTEALSKTCEKATSKSSDCPNKTSSVFQERETYL
ncbi:solute carrier organic anion transporter family member 1C1-like [Latimeria chalumnae]|uniref:Solute carrier organic anion transporter family member n=1 Tax=Latimeria chalumnae TaxID=7897 RepID=H3B0P1_LATCH